MSEVKNLVQVLPDQLICVTVQMALSDPDTMEEYFRDAPAVVEKCMPVAVRDTIFASYLNPSWQVPIPSDSLAVRLNISPTKLSQDIDTRLSHLPIPKSEDIVRHMEVIWSWYWSPEDILHAGMTGRLPYLVSYALSHGASASTGTTYLAPLPRAIGNYIDDLHDPVTGNFLMTCPAICQNDLAIIYILLRAGADAASETCVEMDMYADEPRANDLLLLLIESLTWRKELPRCIMLITDPLSTTLIKSDNSDAAEILRKIR